MEVEALPRCLEFVKEHEGRGQGGVPAEIHLQFRREPAETPTRRFFHQEGRLGEVILQRDGLHQRVRKPLGQDHHGRRIAREGMIAEGIDLEKRQAHGGS